MPNKDPITLEAPEGLVCAASPGWNTAARAFGTTLASPPPVAYHGGYVPATFELLVTPEDRSQEPWEVVLMFRARRDDGIVLASVLSYPMDADAAIDRLRKIRRLDWWKKKTLVNLARDTAENELAAQRGVHWFEMTEEARNSDTEGNAFVTARVAQATLMPVTRKRNRVTETLLLEVAGVYRQAWEAGKNPTSAVAAHFQTSHSTAARWVNAARKVKGGLGPANGTKGGVGNDEA